MARDVKMMGCGCAANAKDSVTGKPVCSIHFGYPGADEVVEPPDLAGRVARCTYCSREEPSSLELAFFEYMGPGSPTALEVCVCGYHAVAHEDDPSGRRRNVVKEGKCPGFRPKGDRGYDRHYCGCAGWD